MPWTDPERLSQLIQSLDEVRFVALCNAILGETAAHAQIPRSCLSLNLRTKEPDGGVDARCEAAPTTAGRLIPQPDVIYQFKSGSTSKSITKIVDDDIVAKPRVLAALEAGSAFVYVTAWDRGEGIDDGLVAATAAKGIAVENDQISFVGREVLGQELLRFPGIVARFLGIDDAALVGFEEWSATPRLGNPFRSDDTVSVRMADLRARLAPERAAIRIFGAAGDGKTRLVLESLRESEFQDAVLYAAQAEDVSHSVIAHLKRTPDARCTLVVDEVDDDAAERILERMAGRPAGVRLVLIGVDASRRTRADSLQVPGLSAAVLVATIQAIVPGLELRAVEAIAGDCEGSPKLAVLIARSIQANPELILPTVLTDGDVRSALDRYLRPLGINQPAWEALSCACLLMRVGWKDEVETESVQLFESRGIQPAAARREVELLHDRFGIAPLGGRYRYISPAILADHLAARQLESWTRDELAVFFRSLTPEMAESFAKRARRLHGILRNRAAIEEVILGDQGPFRDFHDLESGGFSFILQHMAGPFPERTLRVLERCLGPLPADQLRAAKNSRRDVVWALQELLWPEDTFERAARLLLELAVAENETWANNASGIWVDTFQTFLGRTAAAGPARARAVRFAAQHATAEGRVLAARAVAAAFRSGHISRAGMPPADIAGMPQSEWSPKTWGELADSLLAYLEILASLVADKDDQVSGVAASVLGDLAIETMKLPARVFDHWLSLLTHLANKDSRVVRPVLVGMEAAVRRWSRWLADGAEGKDADDASEEERSAHRTKIAERLETLRRTSTAIEGDGGFGTRLRDALSLAIRIEVFDHEDAATVREELRVCAAEAVAHPNLMDRQWDWMLTDKEWSRSERWIEYLGEADSRRVFEPVLERLASSAPRAVGWRSLYDSAFARAGNDDAWLATRATQLIRSGDAAQAFDLFRRTEYSRDRYVLLRDMFEKELIPASWISQLAYTSWIVALSVDEVRELLVAAKSAPLSAARTFLSAYTHQHATGVESLRAEALELLKTSPDEARATNDVFDWDFLATRLVDGAPLQVAQLALHRIGVQEVAHDIGLTQVLRAAWDHSDKTAFFEQIVAHPLIERTGAAWWQRKAIGQLPLHTLPAGFLLSWVEADPPNRARPLADVLGPPSGEPDDLDIQLLERYGTIGVEMEFWTQFMSGNFMGHESIWLRGKLAQAERWASHASPAVSDWGRRLVESLIPRIRRAETEEAEERFV